MRPAEFDYKRYQRDKVRKKINQRKFEERMETSPYYQPKIIKIGDRGLTVLEAKDNTEMRFIAEMYNRSAALSRMIAERELDYSRLTITFPTKNRVEKNFFGSVKSADNYLGIQNNAIRHFISSIVRRYKKATGMELQYKYNIEVQLLSGVNLHAHVIFYHERDSRNTIALSKIIMDLRYAINNTHVKKKKKPVRILGVGRLYLQVSDYHRDDLIDAFSLLSEQEIYRQLNMKKSPDTRANNYAGIEYNVNPYKNLITGSWLWFSFLDAENMSQMHAEHDQYDNKANVAHTHTELLRHIEHDTKALMQNDSKKHSELTAELVVENIKNDWCKNYVNNTILEDLGVRRMTTSQNLLFPIHVYRRCREQLIKYDEDHKEIYFTTMQLKNDEIAIEKNDLYTQVINTRDKEVIAQFKTKKGAQHVS